MLQFKTYAENLRVAMKTKNNAQGRPLKIRELANMTGFSYEHIRKLRTGKYEAQKFSVGRDCNDLVCEVLGLDAEEMWQLAQREKFAQKTGYAPLQLEDPEGREMSDIWGELDHEQRMTMLQVARSMWTAHHQEQHSHARR